MTKILTDQPIMSGEGILHHAEGVDLMPANIEMSGMEVSLVNAMSRETIFSAATTFIVMESSTASLNSNLDIRSSLLWMVALTAETTIGGSTAKSFLDFT